ncbi:hypothetical protein N9797_01765 [Gammaproteobacteria bacterium]|jgi:hypothetical protein|nr:hypothetical protein [Gammaproteobacteria bacterium]
MNHSNNLHKFLIFFLVLFSAFLCIYGAKFGLDLTDTGFFLYSQNRLLSEGMSGESIQHIAIGSDWVGAAWIKYIAGNSLYVAKLGSIFYRFLIVFVTYLTISKILKNKTYSAYISIFSLFAFGPVFGFTIINYDLAPLLPAAAIGLLLVNYKNISTYSFILIGFLLSIMVLMRTPLLLTAFLFIIFLFFSRKDNMFKNGYYTIFGFSIPILCIFFISPLNAAFQPLIQTISGIIISFFNFSENPVLLVGEGHNPSGQLMGWIKSYIRVFIAGFFMLLFVYKAPQKSKIFESKMFSILAVFFLFFVLSIQLPEWMDIFGMSLESIKNKSIFSTIIPAIIFISSFELIRKLTLKDNEFLLLFFIIILFITFPVGSNSFGHKFSITFIVILPILYSIISINIHNNRLLILRQFLIIFSVATMSSNMVLFYDKPYRDSSVFELKSDINATGLYAIKTTERRSIAVAEALNWLEFNSSDGDTLLAFGKISMFNFLLQMPGVFDLPWPSYMSEVELQDKLDILEEGNNLPKYIIMPLDDVDLPGWPGHLNKSINFKIRNIHIIQNKIDKFYTASFKSNDFIIYSKELIK